MGRSDVELNRSVCPVCEEDIERKLITLGGEHGLYATLIGMGAGAYELTSFGRSERSAKRVEAPAPLNVNAVSLTAESGAVATLRFWVNTWHVARKFQRVVWSGPAISHIVGDKLVLGQLDIAINALLASLSWAAECRDDFGEFRQDVERLVTECKRIIDPTDPDAKAAHKLQLGHCPTLTDGVPCRNLLSVRLGSVSIRCSKCGTSWPMGAWPKLAKGL
jgi:LSD1 subclass zinc finger protein